MRRVRGGPVEGESETGHGRGQTITRSIEDVIQTKESGSTETTYTRGNGDGDLEGVVWV